MLPVFLNPEIGLEPICGTVLWAYRLMQSSFQSSNPCMRTAEAEFALTAIVHWSSPRNENINRRILIWE